MFRCSHRFRSHLESWNRVNRISVLLLGSHQEYAAIRTYSVSRTMDKVISPRELESVKEALPGMRRSYHRSTLDEASIDTDPFVLFGHWLKEAEKEEREPNAMCLSTCTPDGYPSGRMVLLKGVEDGGFLFYTNLLSRKSQELRANPRAALTFYWPSLERQVRVEGVVEQLPEETAAAYFATRPRASQLGAWASSHQSSELPLGRRELEERLREVEARFPEGQPIPKPDFWGGWKLIPRTFEFWQGRVGRLHDRIKYTSHKEGDKWVIARLSP